MKNIILSLVSVLSISSIFCFSKEVHEFIGQEALEYYNQQTYDPTFYNQNSTSYTSRFLLGTRSEDQSDWTYGCGEPGGRWINVNGLQNDFEQWITVDAEEEIRLSVKHLATHVWDSDDVSPLQYSGHLKYLNYIREGTSSYYELTIGPVPTALTKAERTAYGTLLEGDEITLFTTHELHDNMPTLPAQAINEETGLLDPVFEYVCNYPALDGYVFEYKIKSLDDFLIGHNIVLNQANDVWVHLSDQQFIALRNSVYNPEYEYLGRLSHLLMDMAVPSHAHKDGHGPTLCLYDNEPTFGAIESIHLETDDFDYFEGWGHSTAESGLFHYNEGGYLNYLSNLSDLPNAYNDIISTVSGFLPLPSASDHAEDFLYDLFFTINQIAQNFASEDVNGNDPENGRYPLSHYPFIIAKCNNISDMIAINPELASHDGVHDNDSSAMPIIRDCCVPLAIIGTATLIDWWQNRYGKSNQNVEVVGNIGYTGIGFQNTSVRLIQTFPEGAANVFQTTPDAAGNFSFIVNNPQLSYYDLWVINEDCHPVYTGITLPGHPESDYNLPSYNVGHFYQELLDVTGLHVNQINDYNAFHDIQAAVDYAIDHNISRITIESGTYTESVGIHVPEASELSVLEIYGTPQQTIIKPIGNLFRNFSTSTTSTLDRFEVKDIIFDGLSSTGQPIANCIGAIKLQGDISEAVIKNCTIRNYNGNCFDWDDEENGRAIRTEVPTLITNCLIYSNRGIYEMGQYPVGAQGIVAISGISTIENCQIFDNTAADAGAIYVQGSGATVRNCHIYNNYSVFQSPETPYPNSNIAPFSQTLAIKCVNASNVTISQNVFSNNGYSVDGITSGAVIGFFNTTPPSAYNLLQNNTFINDVHPDNSECLNALRADSFSKLNLTNNVFAKFSTAIEYDNPPVTYYTINNNLFWQNTNNFSGIIYDTITNPSNCMFENPHLSAIYLPLWNTNVISPCIDAGFGDADIDGTPPDIGARRAIAHQYWEYSFTTQADLERWYWVSYPVLNSVTDDMLVASDFFIELLELYQDENNIWHPKYIDEIDWMESGYPDPVKITWVNGLWTNINHIVSSPQGYKVKLHQLMSGLTSVTMRESGFKTPSDTQFPIYGGNVENWLGYFRADPAWPHEVFASIWDDINMIKTKNWCLVRANPLGDYWGMHGKVTSLKEGDMVIVTTNNNHTFQWNNADATPPDYKAPPEHFIFNEKQDYVPIYISLPDSLVSYPKEVGFYLDGICKGAVVIEKNLEQICAYLDLDDDLSHGLIEFIFYYNDDKSQPEERKVVRLNNSRFQARYANGNARYPFYDISISKEDMDNVALQPLNLGQNYPNPFNPSTTINYQLPQPGRVRLDVLNVRGQLVRTLLNTEMEAGEHSVIWNGADAHSQSVGSGIYFYRLSSPAGTLSKRMLLMK